MNNISLFSQSLFALSLKEAIDTTIQIGFDAIELACISPHFDIDTALNNPDNIADYIKNSGLKVSALSLFNNFTDHQNLDDEINKAITYIKLAPLFETKIIKVTPGSPSSINATKEHWNNLEIAIKRLLPIAKSVGVKLAFETHMRQLTDTLAGSKKLLEIINSDIIGLTVDFSNLSFANENLSEAIYILKDRIYNTHLKNGTIDPDGKWNFKALNDGLTDYKKVFPLLHDIGYNGYLTIECLSSDAKTKPIETVKHDLDILLMLKSKYYDSLTK
jgi:sugar phosphate isomerase/epimerase